MPAKKKYGAERLGASPREARLLRQGLRASARLPGAEGPRMPGDSMDDAQRRAKDFNAAERIDELEQWLAYEREENERLRKEAAHLRRALKQQKPADDDVHALVRGLKALVAGRITVTKLPKKKAPKKKTTPRAERREIIRKAGAKGRAVLNRLRDYDKNP